MPNRYFGTDGIRGKYNSSFLNEKFIRCLGYSIAEEFRSVNNKNVLIGFDTRQSCKEILNTLSEGLYSNGFKIFSLGIAPTPAVSKLTRDKDFSIGIMISASHNPYHDNGLKIFDENGIKLSSNIERSIEKKIKLYSQQEIFQSESKIENSSNLLDEYKKNCIQKFKNTNLSKNKIIIDTANGANSFLAYEIYSQLFDEVKVISNVPDGTNINNQCGSTYLKNIFNEMKKGSFDFGLSMDGDGDRVIIINSNYEIIDGDDILYVIAKGKLINNEKIEKAGFKVTKFLSGPIGGDAQIATRVAEGKCDIVIFFRDPLDKHPHEPDISMLMRICDVHDVPLATNPASANLLFRGLVNKA